jgi:hypothetical protein
MDDTTPQFRSPDSLVCPGAARGAAANALLAAFGDKRGHLARATIPGADESAAVVGDLAVGLL